MGRNTSEGVVDEFGRFWLPLLKFDPSIQVFAVLANDHKVDRFVPRADALVLLTWPKTGVEI